MSFLNVTSTTLGSQGEMFGELLSSVVFSIRSFHSSGSLDASSLAASVTQNIDEYKAWWFNLLHEDPIHVLVESVLMFMIAVVVWRGNATKKSKGGYDEKVRFYRFRFYRFWST